MNDKRWIQMLAGLAVGLLLMEGIFFPIDEGAFPHVHVYVWIGNSKAVSLSPHSIKPAPQRAFFLKYSLKKEKQDDPSHEKSSKLRGQKSDTRQALHRFLEVGRCTSEMVL